MSLIKSEYDFYQSINQQEQLQQEQYYFTSNGKVNRGGRKQVKTGTTKRNARERNRVRYINYCFDVLRQHIPVTASTTSSINDDQNSVRSDNSGDLNKKLSKVDTLKFAAQYIKQLTILLEQINNSNGENVVYNSEFNEEQLCDVLSPSTSPFSISSSSTSSTNQQYQDYSLNNNNSNEMNKTSSSYYYQPTNIMLNNININIFNDNNNNEMQVDNVSSQLYSSYSLAANSNALPDINNQNQYYHQYYF